MGGRIAMESLQLLAAQDFPLARVKVRVELLRDLLMDALDELDSHGEPGYGMAAASEVHDAVLHALAQE
jgi:hypothetical protein